MKRTIVGIAVMLVMSSLAICTPLSGASTTAIRLTHAQIVRCAHSATGHKEVTRAELSACKKVASHTGNRCVSGHELVVVKVASVNYGLRRGHKPVRIGNGETLGQLARVCSSSTTSTSPPVASSSGIQVGPGAATTYTVQPQPAAGTCHYTYVSAFPLPDRRCTPGAINPQVTQSNIASTICRSGYTSTIRPPEDVTEKEKDGSAAAYSYTGVLHTAEYDHLISLEIGGDPNDSANLWVEPNDKSNATSTANTKDILENKLHSLVCSEQITLATAQAAIATNWVVAYDKYALSATTPPATTAPVKSPPATAPPATTTPVTASPVTAPPVTAPPVTAPPAITPPAPAGCHPLSSGGNCYEAGELCSAADHGLSGVAGNGEAITCEDNDGWRWEPA
jgi:cell division septation protein DedD